MVAARVVKRSLGSDNKGVGSSNHNKMLDSRIYDVMFMDGAVQKLAANKIYLSMYEHVNSEEFMNKI